MSVRVDRHRLQVAEELAEFIEHDALPGSGVDPEAFWEAFSRLAHDMAPRNRDLLATRAVLQGKIDQWHKHRQGQPHDAAAYREFLTEIGYLVPEGPTFEIETENTDPEFATIAGPQLVVPITNARYALNAANARWGSLYDAFYGTDALGDMPTGAGYDAARGAKVIAAAKAFLDQAAPLATGSHADVTEYAVEGDALSPALKDPDQFVATNTDESGTLSEIILKNNGLHIALQIDPKGTIGGTDPAHVDDIQLESAVTAIMDCEDSVACVDAEDKVLAYRNWLGLMKGDLAHSFQKGGRTVERVLNQDVVGWRDGEQITLKGRALMLVRNVGHLMTNPAILLESGDEIYEGLMDAMITV
ncbi:MAG: malate synthase G, partial [Pseudomonadota bacterium]